MDKHTTPYWLHLATLVIAVAFVVLGVVAWSFAYRVQSATLFSFGIVFALQAYVRQKPGRVAK